MSTGLVVMDPTGESAPAARTPLPLPASVAGKVVGLLDISKPRGDVFLDHVEGKLKAAGTRCRQTLHPPRLCAKKFIGWGSPCSSPQWPGCPDHR